MNSANKYVSDYKERLVWFELEPSKHGSDQVEMGNLSQPTNVLLARNQIMMLCLRTVLDNLFV